MLKIRYNVFELIQCSYYNQVQIIVYAKFVGNYLKYRAEIIVKYKADCSIRAHAFFIMFLKQLIAEIVYKYFSEEL